MCVSRLLATAAETPSAWTNLTFGMTLLVVAGMTALMAAVPVVIARRRRLRAAPTLMLIAVVWGILLATDVGYGINRTETDDARNDDLLRTGSIDPNELTPPPIWPWMVAAAGFVFYAGLVAVAGTKRP
jgi:hypothetical protein